MTRQEPKALNMSNISTDGGESRSQSVPVNYRQSPVHAATTSNDGVNWSAAYQSTNTNSNNSNQAKSACSSVAPTPIPPEYNDFTEMMNLWESGEESSSAMGGQRQLQEQQYRDQQQGLKMFKDKDSNNNNDDFMEEMKSYATSTSGITSRSVPCTPVPGSAPYYPKAYFNGAAVGEGNNGNNLQSGGGGGGMFANYAGQQQHGRFDSSKSVPNTPVVCSQFRYSPVAEMTHRRDILINGNINLDKALGDASGGGASFEYGGEGNGSNDGPGGRSSSVRRRIEKIEGDRKEADGQTSSIIANELSPLEEEAMGYNSIMDTDLMNQFKNEF